MKTAKNVYFRPVVYTDCQQLLPKRDSWGGAVIMLLRETEDSDYGTEIPVVYNASV